jgi:cytoskeleton protein RodZ
MTNETQTQPSEHKPIPFGDRLKSAREALGIERKDAAAQLCLSEKIIIMLEKDMYPADLPVMFIRGYIRSYGKLLQIPEHEIKKGIEPIKPTPLSHDHDYPKTISKVPAAPVTSGNYFMQIFTYLIVFTLLGLVAMWWYSNSAPPNTTENQINAATENTANNQPIAATTETTAKAVENAPAMPAGAPAKPVLDHRTKPATSINTKGTAATSSIPSKSPPSAKQAPLANADEEYDEVYQQEASIDANSDNTDTSSNIAE